VAHAHNGLLRGQGLPSLGQAAELAVRSTAIGARATTPAPGARSERSATSGSEPHFLRLPADPCTAQAPRGGVQSQNGVASTAATGVALDQSETHHPVWAATRRASARIRTQSALGVRHDQYPSVGWTAGPLSHHDRRRGPQGIGVAVCHAHDGRRSCRDAAGGDLAPVGGSADPRTRHRIPQRQWAGVHLASVSAIRASHGTYPVPHAPAASGVNRLGGGVLWELQAGRCLSGVSRDGGRRRASTSGVDRTLHSPGPAQRLGDAVASRVLCGVASQKQDSTCPKLGGAVQSDLFRHPRPVSWSDYSRRRHRNKYDLPGRISTRRASPGHRCHDKFTRQSASYARTHRQAAVAAERASRNRQGLGTILVVERIDPCDPTDQTQAEQKTSATRRSPCR
jgi:hypothetical protein